jgi:hypothetical protein
MDEFLSGLLLEIPEAGAPSPQARERLFPKPTAGRNPETDQDWADFIQPDLEDQFSKNRNRVAEDLRGMRNLGRKGWELDIPREHLAEWIHALNQARIALSCLNNLGEKDLDEQTPLHGPSGLLVFQIQFYGVLQEWMLSLTDDI